MERYFKKGFLNRVKDRKDCRELSGGEKQILLLMRSYASKKDIILLDEVFTSIDLVNREDARNFIFDMDAQLFISVTHDLSEENLRKYDEVLVMENGKLKKDKDFLRLGTVNV
jgi:ABC-type proline/glycine betaine transport system ATPase subunit